MRAIVRHIPNTLTCLNLFCGCIACVAAANSDNNQAILFIILAAVFDFFDGFAARWLKAYSALGKELDSLADVVSFGVAPSYMLFSYLQTWFPHDDSPLRLFPYFAFLIAIFSGLRLAKFNVDERQTVSFIGLPVPANALFWSAFIVGWRNDLTLFPYKELIILFVILLSCWIMISDVPMFSFKFSNFRWANNKLRFVFIILTFALIALFNISGISLTIVLYVILSIITKRSLNS